MRQSLGDVPTILHQPVRRVAAGLVEQWPEFVAIFSMQSTGECEGVEPVTIDAGDSGQRIVAPPGDVAVGEPPDCSRLRTIERVDDPLAGVSPSQEPVAVVTQVRGLL